MTLSGPEVSQPDSGITLYTTIIFMLSLTPNIGTKVSRCDLCILSGSLTRLSGNIITHNTAQHPHVFMLFLFARNRSEYSSVHSSKKGETILVYTGAIQSNRLSMILTVSAIPRGAGTRKAGRRQRHQTSVIYGLYSGALS